MVASKCGNFVPPTIAASFFAGKRKSDYRVLRDHLSTVRAVGFSPDSLHLLTGSDDKSLKIWNLQPQRFLFSLGGHKNWIRSAKWNRAEGNSMVGSCGDDKTVRIWDTRSRACVSLLEGHASQVLSLDFAPSGRQVASCGNDDSVRIWDLRNQACTHLFKISGYPLKALSFHPTRELLAVGNSQGKVSVLDTCEGRLAATLHGHEAAVNCLEYRKTDGVLASGDSNGLIFFWREAEAVAVRSSSPDYVDLALSRDGETAPSSASGSVPVPFSFPSPGASAASAPRSSPARDNNLPKELGTILNKIMDQLETLTDTVLTMEGRLSRLEGEFQSLRK